MPHRGLRRRCPRVSTATLAAALALAVAAAVGGAQGQATACDQANLQDVVRGAADGSLPCGDAACGILTCDARGVVVGISVDAANNAAAAAAAAAAAVGSIPAAIASLSSLQFLELRDVAVTGTLPAALGSLRNLTSLHVSGAGDGLRGRLPASLGALESLVRLDLSRNALTGPLNDTLVCGLPRLRHLALSSNSLGMEVVPRPSFVVETVWSNETAGWNATAGAPPQLVVVNRSVVLDAEVFSGLPDCLGTAAAELESLHVGTNRFAGTLPASLASLSRLQSLRAADNAFSGRIPDRLLGGWLCGSGGGGGDEQCAHPDPALREVALDGNALTGSLPAAASPVLTRLTVAGNRLSGSLPASLLRGNLSRSLAVLNVASNGLSGPVPPAVASLSALVAFLADENALSGALPLPGGAGGRLVVAMANSNPLLTGLQGSTDWCDVLGGGGSSGTRSVHCGLANTGVPCALACGTTGWTGDDVDLASQCGVGCSCPSNLTSYLATLDASDPVATALARAAPRVSCPAAGNGDVCEFACAAGYEPGFVDGATGAALAQCTDDDDNNDATGDRALPAHVLTCAAGVWKHTDVDGLGHGCVQAVCPGLSLADVPHAVVGGCANTPSGGACLVECLPGYTRAGPAHVACDRGTWNVGVTACEAVADALELFNCQPLTPAVLPNVRVDSCKDTPGFAFAPGTTTTTAVATAALAALESGASEPDVYRRLVAAVAGSGLDLSPVECAYECAAGFHPDPAAPAMVACSAGRWAVPAAVSCSARSCDEFWSDWSEECSGYCEAGEDPGKEYRTFSYLVPSEEADVVAAGCDVPNGFVESRNCEEWPRCLSACADHWSEWSACSSFCSGGVITRTFGVPAGTPPPAGVAEASNISWSWDDFLAMTCPDEQGRIEQQNCTNWETCETTGLALSVTLVVGACVTAGTLLVLKGLREEREIRTTRMGKSFLRVAGGDMRRAVFMLKTMRRLINDFPDLKPKSIWFAMDRARRTYKQAAQVLRDAHELMRNHTDMPLVEALERADWQSPARLRTIGNLGRLLVWQKCAGAAERAAFEQAVQDAKAVGELLQTAGEDDDEIARNCRAACNKHPYFHILCHQPWRNPEDQMWALGEMLQHLPLMYLDHRYLPRPCYLRRTPPHNVLHLALERRCAPGILAVLATGAPRHAEAVPTCLFGDYFAFWETQGLLLGHGLAARHLVTKSNAKGRLLERSSSLNRDTAVVAAGSGDSAGAGKSGRQQAGGPRARRAGAAGGGRGAGADDDFGAPVVNRRKLHKARGEELATLTTLVEESTQTRLGARISHAFWTAEGAGNGSAGFVPPHVKARELAQALALYAESLLDPEWVPAFDEAAAVADTGSLLKQLFRMGGMAEAMNAVTPTTMADANGTNWWVDEDGDADGGDYDDSNQSGAGTEGDRRDWYGGALAEAITQNAEKQKQAKVEEEGEPELYPLQKQRKLTQEEEEDEMWLATKKGLNLAQVVPLRYKTKGSKKVERPTPWNAQFRAGFLVPLLVVLKRFLTLEIKAAAGEDEVARLKAVGDVLAQAFRGVYDPVAKEYVDPDYDLPSFLEEMAKINSHLKDEREAAQKKAAMTPPSRRGGSRGPAAMVQAARALQRHASLEDLYLSAHRVMPRFRLFMEDLAARSRAMEGSGVAPLKSMYRSLEKAAFRADGSQWSADSVLDVVRGSLRFETMRAFTRCLRIVGEYEGVVIRRLKDRFSNPTDSGWRDCLINISFADDPDKFICEVQLVHDRLARAEESGAVSKNDFTAHRAASELVRIVAEVDKQKRAGGRGGGGRAAARSASRRTAAGGGGGGGGGAHRRTDAVYLRHQQQQQKASAGLVHEVAELV